MKLSKVSTGMMTEVKRRESSFEDRNLIRNWEAWVLVLKSPKIK